MTEKADLPPVREKDLSDARATMVREQLIRRQAQEMGEDPDEISLGYLFVEAIPDDCNAFAAAELADYDLSFMPAARAKIFFRLDYEKEHPQMPEIFKKRLNWARSLLTSADWESTDGFREASKFWQRGIKEFLGKYIELNPEVQAAAAAFRKFEGRLLSGKLEVTVETQGFDEPEVLKLEAPNLFSAGVLLGVRTKDEVARVLQFEKKDSDYVLKLARAGKSLSHLKKLADIFSERFITKDGVNHLARYFEIFDGFCQGAEITPLEGALLQMEGEAGCQTLIVQNSKTGEVAGIHTEEDEVEYHRSKNPATGKRWVEIKVGERKINFCYYAGICSWGGTSGISEEKRRAFFQAADSIGPKVQGELWANAVAFMTMDVASIDDIKYLAENLKKLPAPIFSGGYILHFIEGGSPPQLASLEFGNGTIEFIAPENSATRSVFAGVNYPRQKELQRADFYNSPENEEERKIMERRQRRLHLLGKLVGKTFRPDEEGWGRKNVLEIIGRVFKEGRGDRLEEWFSGFANELIAQYSSLYVSRRGDVRLIVRKGI